MFKKILFPTDFSDVSEKALAYIMTFKEVGTETVDVIHVIDQRSIQVAETNPPFQSLLIFLHRLYPFQSSAYGT